MSETIQAYNAPEIQSRLIQTTSVDMQIVVSTTKNHGVSRSPPSLDHTTQPSGRASNVTIEQDISPVRFVPASTVPVSDFADPASNLRSTSVHLSSKPPSNGSFTQTQLASPFYRPTVEVNHDIQESKCSSGLIGSSVTIVNNGTVERSKSPATSLQRITQLAELPVFAEKETNYACIERIPSSQPEGHNVNDDSQFRTLSKGAAIAEALGAAAEDLPHGQDGNSMYHLPLTGCNSEPPLVPRFLKSLKVTSKCKRMNRKLRPLERGYWHITFRDLKCQVDKVVKFWNGMRATIERRKLYWVSLQLTGDAAIRVYCFGQCTLQVWVLIYAISGVDIKTDGISWNDCNGRKALYN